MQLQLIAKTQGVGKFEGKSIDEIIVGQARVSTSRTEKELFQEPKRLLRHCILNQHWSIFELANLGFEIETSRAMGRELIRHGKMAGLTEFSQRYSSNINFEEIEFRKQAVKNRQSSTTPISENMIAFECNGMATTYYEESSALLEDIKNLYLTGINNNIAKETMRMVLPETANTKIYMNFRIRELITFLNARLHKTAQKEIRLIAESIRDIFIEECPIISECLFNFEHAYEIHILERIVLEKYKLFDSVLEKLYAKG